MGKAKVDDNIYCVTCGKIKDDKFCNNCKKETSNLKKIFVSDTVVVETSLGIKARNPEKKRPTFEFWDRYRKSGDPGIKKGVREKRIINRKEDLYYHQIIDKNTGEVIHEENEPLTQHKGRKDKKK